MGEAADTLLLDVWEFSKDWVDIRLAKDIVPSLLGLLPSSLQQSHTPLLYERDLAQAIYDTYPAPKRHTTPHTTPPSLNRDQPLSILADEANNGETNPFFSDYQPLSVIEPWMRFYASLFTSHVDLLKIGKSYQNRDILGLRVGHHPPPSDNDDDKPKKRKTVLITGGVHAREWIGTSTVNYVAYGLMTGYGNVETIMKLLDEYDFVFIPTLNPDGYAYTWDTDRLWRKNRQQTNVRFCQGIDLDRGFGFEWDGLSTAGNPCSESFAGEKPWEAVESKALAEWAKTQAENNNVEFAGFIDLHSYSQTILYPYSYSCDDTPPSQENLEELAFGLEKAIRISSSQSYESMPACEGNVASLTKGGKRTLLPRIEEQGGSALDWFYHEMQVKYAYQIKLRDRGTYGFLLPKVYIVPTGKEILDAVLYFGEFLMDGYPKQDFDEAETSLTTWTEEIDGGAEPSAPASAEHADVDEAWMFVEDLIEEEGEWELRRRRKR